MNVMLKTDNNSPDRFVRKTVEELKYFASDFNMFLHYLTKEMTVINIDTVQLKRIKKTIRIIESKHSLEAEPDREQYEILQLLDLFFKFICEENKIEYKSTYDWKVNVYVVRGDSPYETIHVKNISTGKSRTFTGDDVRKWCEFEIEW